MLELKQHLKFDQSVSQRRSFFVWTLCCVLAGLVFLAYGAASLGAGHDEFVMPLDDVYIHFQYARQLAHGQFYVYNPGLPPTSGATSFVYPFVLALGYLLGFQGLYLGLWAMIVGMFALAGSAWLVYLLGTTYGSPGWLSVLVAAVFTISGPISWHFMSGMETGLVVFFALLTLHAVVRRNLRVGAMAAALLALTRPEGSIMALVAVSVIFLQTRFGGSRQDHKIHRWQLLLLGFPIAAALVQPLINLVMTGSVSAAGNQAKSLLSMIPAERDVIWGRVWGNFTRMWAEFAAGSAAREGLYTAHLIPLLALMGMVLLLLNRKHRLVGLMVLGWLWVGAGAISTLDTAFWHFKRYQIPLIALFFPLAAWALGWMWSAVSIRWVRMAGTVILLAVLVIPAMYTGVNFWGYFVLNSHAVYVQPLQMARWLAVNTPDDAVVAVHDVGMMRYLGNRTTLDIVGLTTPNAADYWRNGPGAAAEFLMVERPDYIAAYTEARGLSYLADTGIYDQLLVGYLLEYDEAANVALGGPFQGIFRPDWTAALNTPEIMQPSILGFLDYLGSYRRIGDWINVAELGSERAHHYDWHNAERLPGYPTEVYQFGYGHCIADSCEVMDGGRRINGEESFDLGPLTDSGYDVDVLLVTRLHPVNAGFLDVYVSSAYQEEALVATRWIPSMPGKWLEIATLIPARYIPSGEAFHVRIVPHTPGGYYMPYYHWAVYGTYQPDILEDQPIVTFQNGAVRLMAYAHDYEPGMERMNVSLSWQSNGTAQGDYVVFVHLYADISQPPVAQADIRPGGGTLPPGNWLPGLIRDTIEVDLTGVSPGKYHLAVGMFDPLTEERSVPVSDIVNMMSDGRVFLEDVELRSR